MLRASPWLVAGLVALWSCTGSVSGTDVQAEGNPSPDDPSMDPLSAAGDPGHVAVHRLNKREYDNTLRDLFETDLGLSEEFPSDTLANGFDNNAQALTMTDVHLNHYQRTARAVVTQLIDSTQPPAWYACAAGTPDRACLTTTLSALLPKAWRRPAVPTESDALLAFFDARITDGHTQREAAELTLQAVILSPNFVFRFEFDDAGVAARDLNGWEVASRLSYFLWSSMPDDALFDAAAEGRLTDPTMLANEVTRMLQSPKGQALADSFGSQWLGLRELELAAPDAQMFPNFDEPLRDAMHAETSLLFNDVFAGRLPATQLLLSSQTYANDRLADHYGLATVTGSQPQVVSAEYRNAGVLTHGSVLTTLSHAVETAPVLRGAWILENLLCQDIPAPPPGVEPEPSPVSGQSRRERLAEHRQNAACAACHASMDPMGLALENYDPVGAYREMDNGVMIDPSGELPDGRSFAGPRELAQLIADDPGFANCISKHVLTYALGRGLRSDGLDVDVQVDLGNRFRTSNYAFKELLYAVVQSPLFLRRSASFGEEAP